jgi:hypothetical protein
MTRTTYAQSTWPGDLVSRRPADIAAEARALLDALAASTYPDAFENLLGLSQYVGECLGISARTNDKPSRAELPIALAPPSRPHGRGGTIDR